MTFRQIIRPGDTDDVPPHEHDATEVSGTFNFFRALKGIITGDLTIIGFIRTGTTGNRIEIRPASAAQSASFTLFTGTGSESALIEAELNGDELIIAGPNAGSGAGLIRLLNTGRLVLSSNNAGEFVVLGVPVLAGDGTAAAPVYSFVAAGQQDVGFYRAGTDAIGIAAGAVGEVAQFTGTAGHNLQGLAWTTWTPTLANLNVGTTGTVVARYVRMGAVVYFDIHVTLGGTGISVGDATFTVPVAENAGYNAGSDDRVKIGDGTLIDAAVAIYDAAVTIDDGVLRPRVLQVDATHALQATLTSTVPFTWATGDRMWLHGWYEAA